MQFLPTLLSLFQDISQGQCFRECALKKMLFSRHFQSCHCSCSKGKRKSILLEAYSRMKGRGTGNGMESAEEGDWQGGVRGRHPLSLKQCMTVWQFSARGLGDLGGFHDSLLLTNVVLQSDNANESVHQAVLTLPVQMLGHQALASILPDI